MICDGDLAAGPPAEVMRCAICNGAPAEGFSWQAPHVRVLKCASCGHLYAANPAPGQGMQPMPDPADARREFGELDLRLVRRLLRDGFLFPGVRIVDVGAGIGRVAAAVRDAVSGAQIYCLEPESRASSWLVSQGFTVVNSLAEVEGIDAILLIEVIEHVDDPVALLRHCKRALHDRGRLFLTTPCGETVTGHRPPGGYAIPEHIQFFTERSLRLACEHAGFFEVEFTRDFMHPHGNGFGRAAALAKSALRPLRDLITGRQRLVAYAF